MSDRPFKHRSNKSQAQPVSGEDAAAPFRLGPFRDMTHRWASVDRPSWGERGMVKKLDAGSEQMRDVLEGIQQELAAIRQEQAAIRQEQAAFREEFVGKLDSTKQELKGEIQALRQELKGEIHSLRYELKGDIQDLRRELKGDIQGVKVELKGDLRESRERTDYGFDQVLGAVSAMSVQHDEYRKSRAA